MYIDSYPEGADIQFSRIIPAGQYQSMFTHETKNWVQFHHRRNRQFQYACQSEDTVQTGQSRIQTDRQQYPSDSRDR